MWSHYADGHRGFVLQFDTEELQKNFIEKPQKVFYPPNESYPSLKDFNEKDDTHMFLITKSSHWEYEKEWRILKHIEVSDNLNAKGKIYKFKDGLITRIILGCEMTDKHKRDINKWKEYSNKNALIYEAKKDDDFYKIKVDPPNKTNFSNCS